MKLSSLIIALALAIGAGVSAFSIPELDHRDKLFDIEVIGDSIYIAGFPGLILKASVDNGKFDYVKAPAAKGLPVMAIDFVTPEHGVAVGHSGFIMSTFDGGKSWQQFKSDDIYDHLFDVALADENHGWAVGHFNTIARTTDGGKSWKAQHFELPADFEDEPGLNSIAAISKDEAWVAGEFGTVIHTVDGGQTWQYIVTGVSLPLYSVLFSDSCNGMISGAEGIMLRTSDCGESWEKIAVATENHIFSIFRLEDKVWGVGQEGIIVAYNPDTDAFENMQSDIYTWLNAVWFFDADNGIAVGGRGHVLVSSDGGRTWEKISGM
jgi:photosystem II stability/assembly factor-like uncharacterized protein